MFTPTDGKSKIVHFGGSLIAAPFFGVEMADSADEAQDYVERAYADYLKRRKAAEPKLPVAECDLCGESAPLLHGICIPCRDRYRL
jgi:hypothetical protein